MNEIIECPSPAIKSEIEREKFFTDLYLRIFPSVATFVRKQHGSIDDAKDIFHDALIIYYEKKVEGTLTIAISEEAYVFGIVKHLWIRKTKANKNILFTENEMFIDIPDDFEIAPATSSIISFLKSSGEKCMQLLQAFYYDKQSLERIKSLFGFSSVRSATVQKFKCLEKVREVVKSKSKRYEDFLE